MTASVSSDTSARELPAHSLPARLDAGNAQEWLVRLAASLDAQPVLRVDCAALEQFDSAALSLLLALRRRALAAGKSLAVLNANANLRKLAGLYGIENLLL